MTSPSQSYKKVHYELRPAKQVERRMLIDAFQALTLGGFPISEYQYTGMGSIYFIDFMLFHRLLGMNKMLSVEYDPTIEKRIKFNAPFDCVKTKIGPIGETIPALSADHKHILWLDYDGLMEKTHLDDLTSAATYLSVGSILLITVDVDPHSYDELEEWRQHFIEQTGEYFYPKWKLPDFAHSKLPRRHVEILAKAIQAGLAGRVGVDFIPMFNFLYKDGHQMLTIGGMIGTPSEARQVNASGLNSKMFYRNSLDIPACEITIPKLTRKERQYLDAFMPSKDNWTPKAFELDAVHVRAYRDVYRYCPSYAELML
jgi:hypothetical protein